MATPENVRQQKKWHNLWKNGKRKFLACGLREKNERENMLLKELDCLKKPHSCMLSKLHSKSSYYMYMNSVLDFIKVVYFILFVS